MKLILTHEQREIEAVGSLASAQFALIKQVIAAAEARNLPIYLVGGLVRDLLLGHPSHDLDIVIEGDAIRIASDLASKFGGKVVSHRRFGTAKWELKEIRSVLAEKLGIENSAAVDLPEFLDLISARTEIYERPTALPTVESSSIRLDLQRRDFTINTLAIRLDNGHYGELIDLFGGLADLQSKKIRVLHSLSFVDDPTRMLRAVRFEQRLGFQIEEQTLHLAEEAHPLLHQVSGDRLRHEFDLAFSEDKPGQILARLQALNLLSPIQQELSWDEKREKAFESLRSHPPESSWNLPQNIGNLPTLQALHWLVWLGTLPPNSAAEVSQRFKFTAPLAACLEQLAKVQTAAGTLLQEKPSQVCARLDVVPLASLYAAYLLNTDKALKMLFLRYAQIWRNLFPVTGGEDLRNMGILPGPEYTRILTGLRAAYLDGIITTPQEEKDYLFTLIEQD
jgi:tRNA nucleotidyltransferase (CCA-adding enzyme)